MRSHLACLLLLLAIAGARTAGAQSFETPLTFQYNPFFQEDSTCTQPNQVTTFLDFAYQIAGPVIVYRVDNPIRILGRGFPKTYRPWHVTMTPLSADLSIWVCSGHSGNAAYNCSDVSDNGFGMANQVTVPGEVGEFYVIVAGNVDYEMPVCGQYILSAIYG